MNQLNVSLQHSIMTLAAHGWSHRRIARELDIHRETVGRHLRLADSKPAISTAGSTTDPAAKPAISTLGATAGRQSLCLPWQRQIEADVLVGLSAQRIYQDLVGEHGFRGSYLRWAFGEAAVIAKRDALLGPLAQRLEARMNGNKFKANTVLAIKLARAVYFMLKQKTVFDPERLVAALSKN